MSYLSQKFVALGIVRWICSLYQARPLLIDLISLKLTSSREFVIVLGIMSKVQVELLDNAFSISWGSHRDLSRLFELPLFGLLEPFCFPRMTLKGA